jgi:adenosylmethionine-8-amino-7-oxononanoate aminotransferase
VTTPPVLHPFAGPARDAGDYIEVVRGEGSRVWDAEGRSYLDGTASLWYCAAGHGRTEIADAVAEQMRAIAAYHTFSRFTNRPARELAAMVLERGPLPDGRVHFTLGGSEAIDSALKLARATHRQAGEAGRTVLLSRTWAYHGVMYGGVSIGGLPGNRQDFGPLLPECFQVDHDSLDAMRAAVAYHGPDRIAAIVTEPVQGAGGVFPPPPGYLEGLRALADECGALLVFDEVITGFGRLGTWFGAQHFGVTPDLLCFAKAVTSGYLPLGGVIAGPRVRDALERDAAWQLRHGTTYSGHPSACAAGVANVAILDREGLPDRARAAGTRLRAALDAVAARAEGVTGVRGEGLMQAVVLESADEVLPLSEALLRRGVLGRPLPYASALAFSPPLVVTDEEVDELAAATAGAMAEVVAARA